MRLLTTIFVLVSLTMASSRGYSMRQPNDLTVSEKLPNEVHTAVQDHDLTGSVIPKKKDVAEAATAISTANLGNLRTINVTDSRIMNIVVDLTLALLEALNAAASKFIETFVKKAMFLFDKLPIDILTGLMESPLFDSVMNTLLLPLLSNKETRNDYMNVEDTRGQLYTTTKLFSKNK